MRRLQDGSAGQPAWRGRGRGGWSCHTSDTAKRERAARETAVSLVCHGRAPVAPSRSFTRASTQIIEKKRGTSRHTCGWLPTVRVPASKCQRYLWHSPLRSFHPDSSPLRTLIRTVPHFEVGNCPSKLAKWGTIRARSGASSQRRYHASSARTLPYIKNYLLLE